MPDPLLVLSQDGHENRGLERIRGRDPAVFP
jgi:hypothetical protein